MSTATPPPPTTEPLRSDQREIRIISHSTLVYYWPVWLLGLLFGLITLAEQTHVAFVPNDASVVVEEPQTNGNARTVNIKYTTTKDSALFGSIRDHANEKAAHFPTTMSVHPYMGMLYSTFLFLTIFFTNVPLRGLWSIIAIAVVVLVVLILMLTGVLDALVLWAGTIHPRMNSAFYFATSLPLLVAWLLTVTVFDKQVYMVFTPGQLRVCLEIGGGETAYDTMGMVVQKQRDDLFRHWILGLGSGDLVVRTSGANHHEFILSNVLFIGTKLNKIMEMQRDRPTVAG